MEPGHPEQWGPVQEAVAAPAEADLGPDPKLSKTKVNPEEEEPAELAELVAPAPAPPSAPSGQTCFLCASPVEGKASLRSTFSELQSPSYLIGSSSEQQPSKPEEPSPLSAPSPVPRSTRLKNSNSQWHLTGVVGPCGLGLARRGPKFSITTNWCFAAISLLLICSILLSMVIIMGAQVGKLSNMAKEQTHLMHLQILILTETLRQLQTGQDHTCSVCKIKWVQRAEHCFLFSGKKMTWHWSKSFCKEELSVLAIVDTQEEMDFLLRETNKYFDLRYGQYKYHKFWIGLTYNTEIEKWIWANGTPCELKLHPELGRKGCIYLQNGKLHSQDCSEVACFICKTEVQFGWS